VQPAQRDEDMTPLRNRDTIDPGFKGGSRGDSMVTRAAFLRLAAGAGAAMTLAGGARADMPRPSKAEMEASIKRGMEETYLSENGKTIWGNTGISISYAEPKIGQLTKKQMYYGKAAQEVWPVRMPVKVTVTSSKRATETIEWAAKPSDVWFFHKNAFGEWVYKVGSE
jgi:hypothetical protein